MAAERSGEFDDIHAMAEKEKGKEFGMEIPTDNEFGLAHGRNLPNHSMSLNGRGAFIHPTLPARPIFRTKQSAYRFAGWLLTMAEVLPDEDDRAHTFDEILGAIERSGKRN